MQKGLQDYAEYVKTRNEMASFMKMVDPRTEAERMIAAELAQSNKDMTNYEKGRIILTNEL